ncbi:phage tail protein [Algicola sagamiensis]|uniref:phage tail protein n=1 Tax=Algicola sagamiensis TaxID=163869 RepID=UPI000360DF7B|nr:phage tail protein [Algicola sagamiensis]
MSYTMLILTNPQQEKRYRFSLNTATYQNKNRTTNYRWAQLDRLQQQPGLQFLGPGEDTLEISGVIYPHFRGGFGQLDAMREEAGKGEPFILVKGTGEVFGKFAIESITEEQEQLSRDGTPKKVSFSLSLRKFGEDV